MKLQRIHGWVNLFRCPSLLKPDIDAVPQEKYILSLGQPNSLPKILFSNTSSGMHMINWMPTFVTWMLSFVSWLPRYIEELKWHSVSRGLLNSTTIVVARVFAKGIQLHHWSFPSQKFLLWIHWTALMISKSTFRHPHEKSSGARLGVVMQLSRLQYLKLCCSDKKTQRKNQPCFGQ